ncbi:hypothetical protein [Nocardia sp. NPDC057455]|uniref:hypothetical protein n=1 Tax=Nocardia sp. NPDC057455 TaxID=3346138 RepID=UPI00367351B8
MTRQHGTLSVAQVRILRTPSYGEILTEHQIKLSASRTERKPRQALPNLLTRKLTVTRARRGRYEITPSGRKTLAAKASATHFKINGTWWRAFSRNAAAMCHSTSPAQVGDGGIRNMLRHGGGGEAFAALPGIRGFAEVELAHRQMRRHLECRIDRCAWKAVAFHTLVRHGRIVPQKTSPRQRAHQRGIDFPTDHTGLAMSADSMPEPRTFQQVLDGLRKLAEDLRADPGFGCQR